VGACLCVCVAASNDEKRHLPSFLREIVCVYVCGVCVCVCMCGVCGVCVCAGEQLKANKQK